MATGEASKPPNLGLLTRTLVESPVIKWIIPARIRHASKNDAIFVSKRAVQIQEIRRVGNTGEHTHLELVAVKNDFDSSIRAARVLGLPRAHEEEKPRRSGIDAIVKQEDTESPEPEALLQPEMPPHILAVTLESMKLVFICAFHQNQDVHFLSSYRQLPSARSCSEQLGEHLAVDPKSRAMAVAANEGSFRFYALKRMEVLKQEVDSAEDLKDARLDPIEGVSTCPACPATLLISEAGEKFQGGWSDLEDGIPTPSERRRRHCHLVACDVGEDKDEITTIRVGQLKAYF